ncbi:hypothetical protein ACO0LG_01610 [Undibacterium sp. Ji42W]|uniref:hypothetical protein n=1 Tax=Undibacterium sp. Ji42W TaxID=3413039 RepID=UPI003BEF69DA
MLKTPFLEFVRDNAPENKNFVVGLPELHSEISSDAASVITDDEGRTIIRDLLLDNVIRPLINASSTVKFFHTKFSDDSFGGEGANLKLIIKQNKQYFDLIPGVDPIDNFRKFWGGWHGEPGNENCRGYVLFKIDDPDYDLRRIFSYCYDPAVKALSSLRSSVGSSKLNGILTTVEENPQSTLILLGHMATLSSLVVFPGMSIFKERLEEAISSTRTFVRK